MVKLEKEVLSKLQKDLESCETIDDIIGKNGVLKNLAAKLINSMLKGEMDNHLGYEKHARTDEPSNSRNGFSKKDVRGDLGEMEISVPRDRAGKFDPVIVKKYQKSIGDIDEKIISMYARGMTTRDIQEHLEELYGIEMSPAAVTNITERVMTELSEWQSRPLEKLYIIIYFDALFYKVKEKGKYQSKAVYTCLKVSE